MKGRFNLRTLFYRDYDTYEGLPPRLYRHPNEIAGDIRIIKERIEKIKEQLNVRSILGEVIMAYSKSEPDEWIPRLSEITSEAEETLDELNQLSETLDGLRDELEETRCALMN